MDDMPMQAMAGLDLETLVKRFREEAISSPDSETSPARKNCEICNDTGWRYIDRNTVVRCSCQDVSNAKKRIADSGLESVLKELTFDRYTVSESWQKGMLEIAESWTQAIISGDKPWMFFGGAVGSGKTHLCTAACGELLKAGIGVRYMLWPSESRQLRSCVTDMEAFEELAYPLERARVLYIEDLFKTERGAKLGSVSTPEVKVAFEILDARYRMNLPTIISTEWMMSELLELDEGTFSRVYQKSRRYIAEITRAPGRNMRIR